MSRFRFLSLSLALCVLGARAASAQPGQQPAPGGEAGREAPPPRELPARPALEVEALAPVAGGLTADRVARRAAASSATVRAKRAEVEAAEARIRQTTAQFFPRLTLEATYTRLSPISADLGGALVGAANPGPLATGPCPFGPGQCVLDAGGQPVGAAEFSIDTLEDNYALKASLGVPLSDYLLRLAHAAGSAKAGRRSAALAQRAERLKVKSEARVAFYSWLRATGQTEVAEKSLERTQARLADARTAYTLGAISKADLMRLEALVAKTELMIKEAQTLEQLSAEQLAVLMHDKSPKGYRVGEDVRAPPPATVRTSLSALVSEAHQKRLELRALGEARRAARSGASATAAGQLPRLDAFGEVAYANPNQLYFPPQRRWDASWLVGVRASWTIGDFFVNQAGAAELDAKARGIEAQRKALKDGIRQQVTAAYLQREKARTAIATSGRALAAAREAYRVASDLYRVGKATTTELIDAESDLLGARLAEIDALIQLRISETQLRHATGRDVSR